MRPIPYILIGLLAALPAGAASRTSIDASAIALLDRVHEQAQIIELEGWERPRPSAARLRFWGRTFVGSAIKNQSAEERAWFTYQLFGVLRFEIWHDGAWRLLAMRDLSVDADTGVQWLDGGADLTIIAINVEPLDQPIATRLITALKGESIRIRVLWNQAEHFETGGGFGGSGGCELVPWPNDVSSWSTVGSLWLEFTGAE